MSSDAEREAFTDDVRRRFYAAGNTHRDWADRAHIPLRERLGAWWWNLIAPRNADGHRKGKIVHVGIFRDGDPPQLQHWFWKHADCGLYYTGEMELKYVGGYTLDELRVIAKRHGTYVDGGAG